MIFNRASLVLLVFNGMLITALAWVGFDHEPEVQWIQIDTPAAASVRSIVAPRLEELPAHQREIAWQRPLFSPDRQPDLLPSGPVTQALEGIRLTGVVVDRDASWVLLRLSDQRNIKLKQGESLEGGWMLHHVDASSATFERQGQTRTLNLPVLRLPASGSTPLMTLPHVTVP